jgi:hypothetical protein
VTGTVSAIIIWPLVKSSLVVALAWGALIAYFVCFRGVYPGP